MPGARESQQKVKLGIVGLGSRGHWIAELFKNHGGYEIRAVADYFQAVVEAKGSALGVEAARRFSGLSGYRRVLESGVEAMVIIGIPYFFPEQARAAVEAGLHVYMAKPVAVDVPGALAISAAGSLAKQKQRVFLVDYQMPTDPSNMEVVKRVRAGGIGKLAQIQTRGISRGWADPPRTATLESRLQRLTWVNDIALGCDYIGNFDIHALDAALWVLGQRPVSAAGSSRICRLSPHGDSRDVCSVVFDYANGVVHNHFGQGLANLAPPEINCRIFGLRGHAFLDYYEKAQLRSDEDGYNGPVTNLYEAGAVRNIAVFHQAIVSGRGDNATVSRAVDGVLTCVLGREAAARGTQLTMEQVLKESRRLEVDLSGLKV